MFAVEEKSRPGVIGFCGLVHPGGQLDPEIKYAFLRSTWGDGIATEAAIGIIEYGALVHGLDYITATTALANVASHRVLLKAGMTRGEVISESDGSETQLFYWSSKTDAL